MNMRIMMIIDHDDWEWWVMMIEDDDDEDWLIAINDN